MADRTSKQDVDNADVLWKEVDRQLRTGIGVPTIQLNAVHWRAAIAEVEQFREKARSAVETSEPPEPTPEMIKQGVWAWSRIDGRSMVEDVRAIYIAMRRMEMRTVEPSSPLSDFVRNASPEEKERVYTAALERAAEQQQAVVDRGRAKAVSET